MKKEIKFSFEEHNYECILEATDKETIKILIKEDSLQKFKKTLNLKEIYEQIRAFKEYSMEEFFSALDELGKDNITLSKSSDRYYLDLTFKVLKKEKHLKLEINEVLISKDEIIQDLLKRCLNNKKRIENLIKEIDSLKYPKEVIQTATDYFDKGMKFGDEGKFEEALDCFNRAIETYPKNHRFFANRSLICFLLSQFNEALEDAEKAISLNPENSKAYFNKGKALEGLRRNKEALEAYNLGLEKDKNNESLIKAKKELELSNNFKISNIKNRSQEDKNLGKIISLLILKDGRISVGHKSLSESNRETGIDIYGQIMYNRIMFIKGLGPYQTELKDGKLAIGSTNLLSIVKLNKTTYDVLQNIKTKQIGKTIELYNGFLANNNEYFIYFYKKNGDEYSLFQTCEPRTNEMCVLINEGKPNELVIYDPSFKKYELQFFDYESKKVVKSLNINKIDFKFSLKLSDNIIAIPFFSEDSEYGHKILLVDTIKREIIKNFEINKVIKKGDIHLMTLLDEKTMLLGYSENLEDHVLQYNIINGDLELIDESKTIEAGSNYLIVKLSGGRLFITADVHGWIFVQS